MEPTILTEEWSQGRNPTIVLSASGQPVCDCLSTCAPNCPNLGRDCSLHTSEDLELASSIAGHIVRLHNASMTK